MYCTVAARVREVMSSYCRAREIEIRNELL